MRNLPRWTEKFLRIFCPDQLVDQITGDLIELYHHDTKTVGGTKAKVRLMMGALRFFRPGILIRNQYSIRSNYFPMFKNYLVTSIRHIRKSKINFAFKIGGLSLAIFSFLVIAVYVSYQMSFDRYHADYETIYRVTSERSENGTMERYGMIPMAIGPILQQEIPDVYAMTRINWASAVYLQQQHNVVDCENLVEADTSIFSVLSFDFLKGDRNALKKPNSIVLTRTMADRMFGTTDVLQKLITINLEEKVYEVTAVIEDMKPNSHLYISAIIPMKDDSEFKSASITDPIAFVDQSAMTYVRLRNRPGKALESKIEKMLDKYVEKSERTQRGFRISFQPIQDIYLGPIFRNDFVRKGSKLYVYVFSVLGALLLVVAVINYINLSIVSFTSRQRETGVRRVLGARKYQIVGQLLTESMIFTFIAVVLALGMLYIAFPFVTQHLDDDLRLDLLAQPNVFTPTAFALLVLILVSSLLPARHFTSITVDHSLKQKAGSFKSSISQTLLFMQFTISTICLGCTLVVGKQIGFIHKKELGFDRRNLLVLSMPWEFTVKKMQAFKHELKQLPSITAVSNSSFRIGGGYWKDWYFVEHESGIRQVELYEVFSDDELFETLRIKVLSGRTFQSAIPFDSGAAFVINETAARELGWDDPIGKRIYTHPEEKGKWDGTVVGVVSDINISPLYEKVRPLVMRLPWQNEYPDGFIYIRYEGDEKSLVESIDQKYKALMPGYPLAYRFVDEFYNSQHVKEEKVFGSLKFGSLIIITVSALGMFSMAAFVSIARMKEFGIRKVLGASVHQIAGLHIGYFLKLVLIANGLALPIAYYLMNEWLSHFAYRTEVTAMPFILAAVTGMLLVVVAGGYSSWKSGQVNPVDIIKME